MKGPHISQHLLELNGKTIAKMSEFHCQFLFHDLVVLFFFGLALHGLPGKTTFHEVD